MKKIIFILLISSLCAGTKKTAGKRGDRTADNTPPSSTVKSF
ncbi:MAG TPA: hypothetical protein PKM63_06725 [Panacibacter sp.]|nr:hypothetical protein [Panacibacter sp.]HNP43962.1 hypothetical protein [Panacibacter sp.]